MVTDVFNNCVLYATLQQCSYGAITSYFASIFTFVSACLPICAVADLGGVQGTPLWAGDDKLNGTLLPG